MSENKKLFSAQEAALAVLTKAKEILEESSLMKAEKLKKDGQTLGAAIGFPGSAPTAPMAPIKKYETENNPKPGVKYGKIEKDQKPIERDYNEYNVKPGNSKDSSGPRLKKQVSPSGNPKEEAEGNNAPNGMEPPFEFKDKVSKELAKEKASHMVKSQSGMHTVVYKSTAFEKSEDQANDLMKSLSGKEDRSKMSGKTGMLRTVETGHEKGVHIKGNQGESQGMSSAGANLRETQYLSPKGAAASTAKAKEGHKQVLSEMKQMPKPNLGKAEKLEKGDWKKIHDKLEREGYSKESADKIDGSIKAKLGKGENPDEKQDAQLGEKVEHDVEEHMQENKDAEQKEGHSMASIPMCIGSAKLSKFMEYRHAKKKAQMAQQAAGQQTPNAPPEASTQSGKPDEFRPKTQPTDGDVNKVGNKNG